MTNQEIIQAINACSYNDCGEVHYIECPKKHLNAMLTFIAIICHGWYDCSRMNAKGSKYLIEHNVGNRSWRKHIMVPNF